MKVQLEKAIELRKTGKYKESNELLMKLIEVHPEDAKLNYQCAWSFDVLGEEAKAVPFYERAISLGLPPDDIEGALLGLGSTYRTLGQYEKSKDVFQRAVEFYPHNRAIKVFYSMTLYNLNEHGDAMETLLKCLIETTTDENILSYQKAITFYADKLDRVWK